MKVAGQSLALAKRSREEDDDRRDAEAQREEQRQRVGFAAQARRYAEVLRDSKIEDAPSVLPYALDNYESELLDTAGTLNEPQDAEHLIERTKGHFNDFMFEPGKRYKTVRLGVWASWRLASDDIRAYVQHRPLSEPSPIELGEDSPRSPGNLQRHLMGR